MEKVALDTNILIEILKNNTQIVSMFYQASSKFAISSISAMELYYGARDKKELQNLKKFITFFDTIELDTTIATTATLLIETYAKSHSLTIPDALIAATSIRHGYPLWTLNVKDFHYIDGLNLFKSECIETLKVK